MADDGSERRQVCMFMLPHLSCLACQLFVRLDWRLFSCV